MPRQAPGANVAFVGHAGWGQATIPLIVYNEEYAFLTGYPDPPAGWQTVPRGQRRGQAWEQVPGDSFNGQPYYRQRLLNGVTPQAFTVRVGQQSVASLTTMEWMKISLREEIRRQLPTVLALFVPLRLVDRVFVSSSDWYIAALLHESFHSYQDTIAARPLAAAEEAARRHEGEYPWDDEALRSAWRAELELLATAVRASPEEASGYVQQFLSLRDERRGNSKLSPESVRYEQQREWLEGLGKYTELAIWRQAATSPAYVPLMEEGADPWFKGYTGSFEQRWSQEVDQMRRMADAEGDGRFYYSGWAQAVLLDRLAPGWKDEVLGAGVPLETLLRDAGSD
jgi:hypothetical protein